VDGQLYKVPRAVDAVADVGVDDPYLYPDNFGPCPGHAESFCELGLSSHVLAELGGRLSAGNPERLPLLNLSDEGLSVGPLNSRRFPFFFELNLHAERRFVFRGHRWAFRAGFNNLTNHQNPNVVNSNLGSVHFLQFYGGQHRSMNFASLAGPQVKGVKMGQMSVALAEGR